MVDRDHEAMRNVGSCKVRELVWLAQRFETNAWIRQKGNKRNKKRQNMALSGKEGKYGDVGLKMVETFDKDRQENARSVRASSSKQWMFVDL
jgi:hypothetical protein